MASSSLEKAMSLIDSAHAEDPNQITLPASSSTSATSTPYELHYARKSSSYLLLHTPSASPLLELAVRAQHLRRWEVPRSSYPDGKAGYFAWRTGLKKRQADMAREMCLQAGFAEADAQWVGSLVGKVGLGRPSAGLMMTTTKTGKEEEEEEEDDDDDDDDNNNEKKRKRRYATEVQILEDVACLVFLDDQFDAFERGYAHDEDKILGILRKTWMKMSERGRELAKGIAMTDRARDLVAKAVG